jgi:hypothetical protein
MATPEMIPPVAAHLERRQQYWAIVCKQALRCFDRVASDQVLGTRDCHDAQMLRLFKQLEFYLGIIEEQRHWDSVNDPEGQDKGSAYYIDENCIKSIRRALVCRGFSTGLLSKIFDIFGLYDLTDTTPIQEKDGIGIMALEVESGRVFTIS